MKEELPVIPRIGSLRTTPPTKEEIEQAIKQHDKFVASEETIMKKYQYLYDDLAARLK